MSFLTHRPAPARNLYLRPSFPCPLLLLFTAMDRSSADLHGPLLQYYGGIFIGTILSAVYVESLYLWSSPSATAILSSPHTKMFRSNFPTVGTLFRCIPSRSTVNSSGGMYTSVVVHTPSQCFTPYYVVCADTLHFL
jgi:hypothetical protein